jgi:sigma-B regulation protein RsbU (phosphoserine phosphatase)
LGLALAAVLLILYGVLLRIRKRRGRFIFPLFLKLLVLFVPLMMISAWIEGDWVRDVMKEELEEEYVLRSANLARAIVNSLDVEELEKIQKPEDRRSVTYEKIYNTVNDIVDTRHVSSTPKWILHKIRDGRYYFGISIWRGPIYEPFIVPADRKMFFEVLKQKESRYGCFTDEQGEWFSYLCPVTNHAGRVVNVVELYRPTEEMRRAEQHVTRKVGQVIGITLLVMVPLVLLFSLISTRPLHQLMQATKQLSKGDFSHRISVRSHDETAMLARAFNRMIVDLQKYTRDLERTTADKERIETELRFARDLQRDNLPAKFPPFKGAENVEIYARMEPARQIGGDYYDFFLIDRDHIGVVIADVSGKGMSAGLFMMVVRTLLRSNAMHNLNPASAVGKMNQLLAADNPACMFATLFYFVCNMRTGGVKYVNAGHNPPLVVRKGRAEPLPVKASADHGVATGVLETAEYRTRELHLNSGDRIILYTDGVTEPVNREEEMFGEERMIHIIEAHAAASNHALCDCIYDAVNAHQQGMEQFDDMTMLFFTWRGEG